MIDLLEKLVSVPSFSREEKEAADIVFEYLLGMGLPVRRKGNNIWCESEPESSKPTILLNAHIDTVRPAASYTKDPFSPVYEDVMDEDGVVRTRLYGLGTNDDGGSLIALLGAYIRLTRHPQPYRLVFAATAEEEVCGKGGIEMIFREIGHIDLGVIGEPTGMDIAVAERGLMVLDCTARGKSGHAARNEGVNAIYKALADIDWFRSYKFPKVSPYLGEVKMSVTMINAGTLHNVVPDACTFVVDIRANGLYTNEEILEIVRENVDCEVCPRSTRLGSSSIPDSHPFVQRGLAAGLKLFGSPTTSNQAVSPFTTVKIGPGQSARSHSADEYIRPDEIAAGTEIYVRLLDGLEI